MKLAEEAARARSRTRLPQGVAGSGWWRPEASCAHALPGPGGAGARARPCREGRGGAGPPGSRCGEAGRRGAVARRGAGPAGRGRACALLAAGGDAVGFESGVAGRRVRWVSADRAADALYVGTAPERRPASWASGGAAGRASGPEAAGPGRVPGLPRAASWSGGGSEEVARPASAVLPSRLRTPRGGSPVMCRPNAGGPGTADRGALAAVGAVCLLPWSTLSSPSWEQPASSGSLSSPARFGIPGLFSRS